MKDIVWTLNEQEAQIVINHMAKLPYNEIAGLIEKLIVQARNSRAQTVEEEDE